MTAKKTNHVIVNNTSGLMFLTVAVSFSHCYNSFVGKAV